MKSHLKAERLYAVALAAFQQRGYAQVSLGEIAIKAKCTLEELYRHFPVKQSFVLKLYEQLALDLTTRVADLPEGTMAERFRAIVRAKLKLSEPHRDFLRVLLPAMLDPENPLGVLGPNVERIRANVQGVFAAVVHGATDAPAPEQTERFTRMLYTAHLAIVFLLLQDQTEEKQLASEGLELAADIIELAKRFLTPSRTGLVQQLFAKFAGLPQPEELSARMDRLVSAYVQPPHDPVHFTLAQNILRDLFRHRRLQPGAGQCEKEPCKQCLALHLPQIELALAANEPIHLVLPAFPAKSANLRKVTGPLPDFGEELALRFLQERCESIRQQYSPGAKLTICSDGRVFNDLVGVADDAVTNYRIRLMEMIDQMQLDAISVFDLDDVREGTDFADMRKWLAETYGDPLETVVERSKKFEHHKQLFNGIHRFLFEDMADREKELSRTKIRNLSKDLAYQTIQRSNAWSRLIAVVFPEALRLSIHPQSPHSEKIGILLTPAEDPWLTPWHGVALLREDRFVLTRRSAAEAMGAKLVERDGVPSHFELANAE